MNLFKICKLIQDARTQAFTFCIWLWYSPFEDTSCLRIISGQRTYIFALFLIECNTRNESEFQIVQTMCTSSRYAH